MKQLATLLVISIFLSSMSFAKDAKVKVPRQKIALTGAVLAAAPTSFSVLDLEKFKNPPVQLMFFDPYNKNIETLFYGFYLKDFAKAYAQADYKTLRIVAIDGYKVDVPRSSIEKDNLFVSYKDKAGYLSVDRMGPARIIAPANGVINKDLLLKIGVYWVWQVKTFEFIK